MILAFKIVGEKKLTESYNCTPDKLDMDEYHYLRKLDPKYTYLVVKHSLFYEKMIVGRFTSGETLTFRPHPENEKRDLDSYDSYNI